MDLNSLKKEFYELFGRESKHPLQYFFAPGRVCLIGEHIDYNGGYVMPAAISMGIYGVCRPTDNEVIWMRSTLDAKDVVYPLGQELEYDEAKGWGNYPLGVIDILQQQGVPLSGCEMLFHSNLPVGAGLSSSAAVEVLTGYALTEMAGHSMSRQELAIIGKQAENEFIGVQCGIMDQFAVVMGKAHNAVMLNCDTLEYEHIPLKLDGYELIILNTNVERSLVNSAFNQRCEECQTALETLQQHIDIDNLAEASIEQVEAYITDPVILKRATHVATENKRVQLAADHLRQGNIKAFGQLLNDTQDSLSENYEVSGEYLDAMFYLAREIEGCVGAKMSGAGFAGCGLALVEEERSDEFIHKVLKAYQAKTGIEGSAYRVEITDGVGRLAAK